MLQKTKGIVLNNVKFADKKIISKIYTREFGLKSFVIHIGNSSKSKIKPAQVMPLSQIEMDVRIKENQSLATLSELRCFYLYSHLHTNIYKNTIATFINEVLFKCIKEEETNQTLFDFISNALQYFDLKIENDPNFHLLFLVDLSKYLGFFPQKFEDGDYLYFDLLNGSFIHNSPTHPHFVDREEAKLVNYILQFSINNSDNVNLNYKERKTILEILINYYKLHVAGLKEFQSLQVLQETLS